MGSKIIIRLLDLAKKLGAVTESPPGPPIKIFLESEAAELGAVTSASEGETPYEPKTRKSQGRQRNRKRR
jgi:hypothetical protein